MPLFDPVQLAQWTGGHWHGTPPAAVYGFSNDTRTIREGDCFVALRTGKRDGHAFLADASRARAAAALVERPVDGTPLPQLVVGDTLAAFQRIAARHRAALDSTVVAVTGSCGKTSTKDLLAAMLGADAVLKTAGNLNNFLGVPLTLTRIDPAQHRWAVVEAGINEPGEMEQLARMIRPDAAIVTMIGEAHLERLGSVDGIAAEKSRLPAEVEADGFAVFPESCLCFAPFRKLRCRTLVVREGSPAQPIAGVQYISFLTDNTTTRRPVENRQYDDRHDNRQDNDTKPRAVSGCTVRIGQPAHWESEWRLPALSPGMRSNALLAIVAAMELGVERAAIQAALDAWRPAALRGEVVERGGKQFYVDCYNASPSALQDSFTAFNERFTGGPRLIVLGGMKELGVESARLHRAAVARLPLRAGDRFVLVGAEAQWMRDGLLDVGVKDADIVLAENVAQARAPVATFRGPVFLKGSRAYALEGLVAGDEGTLGEREKTAC